MTQVCGQVDLWRPTGSYSHPPMASKGEEVEVGLLRSVSVPIGRENESGRYRMDGATMGAHTRVVQAAAAGSGQERDKRTIWERRECWGMRCQITMQPLFLDYSSTIRATSEEMDD